MADDRLEQSGDPRAPALVLIVPRTHAVGSEVASATLVFADALERTAQELRTDLSRRLEAPRPNPRTSRSIEDFASSMRRVEAEVYDAG